MGKSAERVRELMKDRHMSRFQLSNLSGVNYSTLTAGERRGGDFSVDTIERICRALGITMAQFFDGWED